MAFVLLFIIVCLSAALIILLMISAVRGLTGSSTKKSSLPPLPASVAALSPPTGPASDRPVFWPTFAEYARAVQNPRLCFRDSALQAGITEPGLMGQPRSISGNYAVVFPMATGGRKLAVRCFVRPVNNQEVRYQGLAR